MSGHSHWSTIKHKKEALDKKKGAIFSRMSRLISLAAREGGANPEMNFELRSAIDKARSANMPNRNIEKAIEKGAGAGDEREEWTRVSYEAFGPGQTAIIIDGITDNKNRTLEEVRSVLSKNGGKMAEQGSVRWLFESLGRLVVDPKEQNREEAELKAISAGAVETNWEESYLICYVSPDDLEKSRNNLKKEGLEVKEHSLDWVAQENIDISSSEQEKLNKLLEALSNQDDVQEVYFNANL
jgi:YebC/PmpR family DNA-binding regulatory protein